MKQQRPLVLEAATAAALCGVASGEACLQQWMLRHPAQVSDLQQAYLNAGVHALCAPTGGTNSLGLSSVGLPPEQVERLNTALMALTLEIAGEAPVAGIISSAGHQPEPFGPLPYTDVIDVYAEQALELRQGGASALLLSGFATLPDIRAAVLGARQAGLPITALLDTEQDGDVDPLPVLLCIQELGVSSFGVCCPDAADLAPMLMRLAPYAKVRLSAGVQADLQDPHELARQCFEALAAGARDLIACDGVTPAHMDAICTMTANLDLDAFPLPVREGLSPILLTDGRQAYFLEKDFSCSPPVTCWPDMSEPILAGEGSGADALLYRVDTVQDAYNLGQNAHKAHAPAVILAGSAEALEMALLYYPGRALIHPDSGGNYEVKQSLAAGYGAAYCQNHGGM